MSSATLQFEHRPIDFVDGTSAIEVDKWDKFPKFVADNWNLKGYIFRGVERSSYELIPNIVRLHRKNVKDPASFPDSPAVSKQLRRFRLNIRGRVTLTDREASSESEIWSLGQHNGLATPLLDWTASPLVAAFFSFIEERCFPLSEDLDEDALQRELERYRKIRDEARSVFALNARIVNKAFYDEVQEHLGEQAEALNKYIKYLEDEPEEGQGFPESIVEQLYPVESATYNDCHVAIEQAEVSVPRVIVPLSGENQRLVSQRGLFTKSHPTESLEQWVKKRFKGQNEAILLKINIAKSQRDEALRWLDAANINFLSLFPDLYGAARFANSRL